MGNPVTLLKGSHSGAVPPLSVTRKSDEPDHQPEDDEN